MNDLDPAAARAGRRLRRVTATAAASATAAVVQLGVGLLVVPLSLAYLGNARYGLWMTATSLTAMLAFADFGMGNGLLNAIASADGKDDDDAAARATASAMFLLAALAVLLAAAFWLSYPFVSWERVLNAPASALAPQARQIVAVTIMCAIASLPLGVSQRVQMGYQEGFLNAAWSAAGSVLGLAALGIAIGRQATLPWLVLCVSGGPVLALAANSVVLFGWRRPGLRPRWGAVSAPTVVHLLGAGALFFGIQLAGSVGYQLPVLAIAHLLGPSDVTGFSVPLRLFMVMPALMGFFLTPLWPAYREAIARGDGPWVKQIVGRSIRLCLGLNVAWGAGLILAGPAVLRWWVGPRVTASLELRVALALWAALTGLGGPFAMLMNAAGALRFQAACAWLMAGASIVLAIVLIPVLGVAGAAFAMVAAQATCILIPSALYVPRILARIAPASV